MPLAPQNEIFVIYNEGLTSGFDIGVEDSNHQRNWLQNNGTYMRMAYPVGMRNGAVFIVSGAVAIAQIVENFSVFNSIAIDLRGAIGGESVALYIEDITKTQTTPQFVINLEKDWKTYSGFQLYEDI